MTIPNPLVITVNAVAKNLPKINQDNYGSEYYLQETLQEFRVRIRHAREKKPVGGALQVERHNVELTHTVYATVSTPEITVVEYVTIRNDSNNTAANMGYINGALTGLLTTGFVSDLRGWQS